MAVTDRWLTTSWGIDRGAACRSAPEQNACGNVGGPFNLRVGPAITAIATDLGANPG